MKNNSSSKNIVSAPMSVRERRQIKITKAVMLIIAMFILLSSGACIADGSWRDFSAVQIAGIGASYALFAASFSSVMLGEWTIGMIPPGATAVWMFILSRHWHDLTCSPKDLPQIVLSAAAVMLTLLVLIFMILSVVMMLASLRTACSGSDTSQMTLVVLGCRLVDDKPSVILQKRLRIAAKWLKRYPDMRCILTGGNINPEERAEAEVMRECLIGMGISDERLTVEKRSTTTYENIRFCKELAQEKSLPLRFAIVTDRFHQYRVRIICRDNDIQSISVNVETPPSLLPQYWSREILCLFEKWIKRL